MTVVLPIVLPVTATAAIRCRHAQSTDWPHKVLCGLGQFGGTPSISQCRSCARREPVPAGTIAGEPARHNEVPQPRNGARENVHRKIEAHQVRDLRRTRTNGLLPEQIALAEARASICDTCEHSRGVTRVKQDRQLYIVKCGLCGCAALNLVRGRCHAAKWPGEAQEPSPPQRLNGVSTPKDVQKLLLRCNLSPGDVVTLTAAVRDLHRAHPGKFLTAVDTTARELWDNNPHVTHFDRTEPDVRILQMNYPLINESNQRPIHFLMGYADYLASKLNVPVPIMEFRGDIHLSSEERTWKNQVDENFGYKGRFWILVAGGKRDFTAKWWSPTYYQQVVDHFLGRVQFVQCGEEGHWHPPVKGTFNLVGKTSIREFVRLVYHADGIVCPVTLAMHLAAAVPSKTARLRPCVVIAGGREPPHWEAYPGHQFLHTIGQLPCCATGGCWKSRCQPVGDGDQKDRTNLCERPVQLDSTLRIPQCMAMIKPANVIDAIERSLVFCS